MRGMNIVTKMKNTKVAAPNEAITGGAPAASMRIPIGIAPNGWSPKVVINNPATRPRISGGVIVSIIAWLSAM